MKKPLFIECLSGVLVFLFVYTSVSKLLEYRNFEAVLGTSPYISKYAGYISIIIPSAELLISLLLLISTTRIIGLYASFFLLLFFTVYLLVMVLTRQNLPCSCGGVIKYFTWWQHIIFNTVFIMISYTGIVAQKVKLKSVKANDSVPLNLLA